MLSDYNKSADTTSHVTYKCEVCGQEFTAPPGLHRGERLCGDGVCDAEKETEETILKAQAEAEQEAREIFEAEDQAREEFEHGPLGVGA